MRIEKGKSYFTNNSDLVFKVEHIYYSGKEYHKVKGTLVNKRNGIVYEQSKNNKLVKSNIKHWIEKCPYCSKPCCNEWCNYCDTNK